ncbi:hypothetical protein F8M41_017105 [Gigaspora margarita]|uniref:Uncharacterized protein n=1 Tax=Gigaspora margarita TaxID=4874 RepID=A0A8H4ANV1_GIGMA|nr:hypothetical protein F8M41_017105 [Gigaspora margarita]
MSINNGNNEAFMIYKVFENNLLLAEDKFLNDLCNLFKYAEEKNMLYDIFHFLKNSESFKKNITIKSFIIYLMGTKLYNKRTASNLEIEYAISLIKESADFGCVYAKNFLEFFLNPNPVDYMIKEIIS